MRRFNLLVLCFLVSVFSFSQSIVPGGPVSFCAGGNVLLSVQGAPAGTTVQWQNKGTDLSGAMGQTYVANSSGSYTAHITGSGIDDVYGPVVVTVFQKPAANFTFSGVGQCSSLPLSFTNTSTGSNLSYQWNFGDPYSGAANTSTDTNPLHHFVGSPANGNQSFPVTLIVTSSDGCSDTIKKTVTTTSPGTLLTGPTINTYNSQNYFVECSSMATGAFTFYNTSADNLSGTYFKIIWGDNTSDFTATSFPTGSPQTHTYALGEHNLLFIVTSAAGCTDTGYYHVFVGSNPAVGLGNPGNTTICTGTALTFPVSNTGSNPAGTLYTVSFNDGTPEVHFTHPAPADITHTFNIGSCGKTNSGYPNSFAATITASNPCLTSSATVAPIYVSQKPKSGFSITPANIVCVGTTLTATNTSGDINDVINGNCAAGKSVWSVSPATGWSVAGGTLGSDNGVANTNVWTGGSKAVSFQFTVPGTYTIKLKGGNQNCGIDASEQTICVNPKPVAAFSLSTNQGCGPLSVTTTNTSNTPLCGSNTYQWSVSYANTSGCTPNTIGYAYINGTGSTSAQPEFSFANPGVYTIQLVTKNSAGLCASAPYTQTVTVKAKPQANLVAPAAICQNGSIAPSVSAVACYAASTPTYAWSFPGGTPAGSATASPGTITYALPGTYTLSLDLSNECGTTTVTKALAVNPNPDLTVPADTTLCSGMTTGPLQFASTAPGTAISWKNNNTAIGLAASGTGNIAGFTPVNNTALPRTAVITVTATLNGCTTTRSFTLTVHPNPAAPVVSTPVLYCQNDAAIPLTATATAGNSLLWYTAASGGTGTPTALTPATLSTDNTLYYVSQLSAATGCESSRAAVTVTVKPVPSITATSANPVSCASATGKIVLNGLTAGATYTVQYTKNGTPVTLINQTAVAGGTLTINNLTAAMYANLSVTLNGCPSNSVGPFALSDPTPPATPVPLVNSPLCAGATLMLSTATVSGATYKWSGPNGFTSTQQNPSVQNVTTAGDGMYSLQLTVAGCTSAAGTVAAVVNATPVITLAAANTPVCSGSAINFSAGSNFSGPVDWAWSGPNGFSSTQQNPAIASATLAEGGLYSVVATAASGGCASASRTVLVAVNPTPVLTGAVGANPLTCNTATGSLALSGLTAGLSYVVSYTKNGIAAVPKTFTAGAGGVLLINNLTAGLYNHIAVTLNGCPSNMIGPFTLVDPDPPATPLANSNAPVCAGETLKLQASTVTGGALAWNWTGPNGFVSGQQNPTLAAATTAHSGTYSVTVSQNGCTSAAAMVSVVVNPTPDKPTVGSNSPLCAGGTLLLTAAAATPGSITWAWTGPDGFTSNLQNPSLAGVTTAAAGIYTITAIAAQGACPSPAASLPVTVYPALVNKIDTAAKSRCYGQPVTISSVALSGGNGVYTAQWEQSTDALSWTSLAGQTAIAITLAPASGMYLRRVVSSGPCQSVSLPVYIDVQAPISNNTVQQDETICVNTAAPTLTGSVPAGADGHYAFQWEQSTNNGITWTPLAGASGKDYVPGILPVTTQFRRVVTTALCTGLQTSTSNVVTVRVVPGATALFLPADTLACPPFTITPATINLQPAAANRQYIWYANGVQIGTGATFPGYTIANENDSVLIGLKALSTFGCGDDSLVQKFKTVRKPSPSFTLSDTVGCGPLTVSFTNTSTYLNQYESFWDFGNGQTSRASQPSPVTFLPNPAFGDTIYAVRLTVFSPCDTLTYVRQIRVKSGPKALFTPAKTTGCSPMNVTFKNTSGGVNNTYYWNFGEGTQLSTTTAGAVQHTFITGVVDTFFVQLKAVNTCGEDSLQYAIVVAPNSIRLNLAINGTDHFGCQPHAVSFINNSQGASAFRWNFGDGTVTTTAKNTDTVRHAYRLPGTYTATLQAVNNCSDTTTTEIITVYPKPLARFTAGPFSACMGDSVRFFNQSDSATAYRWNFGDGRFSTLAAPVHRFTTPGTYAVQLTAYRNNASGAECADSATQQVVITATQAGFFTVTDSVGQCAPLTVSFVNKNTPSALTQWNFGDGASATGDSLMHTYTGAGTYRATMLATTPGGCTFTSEKTITVQGPKGSLQYKGGQVCAASAVRLEAVATGATGYVWDFGDGTVQTTAAPLVYHTYTRAGAYVPRVTLQGNGCAIALAGADTVYVDKVEAGFRWTPVQVCGSTTLQFADTSYLSGGAKNVYWNFGDNTTATGSNPVHHYSASGRYTVQMLVQTPAGCTDTVTKNIDVAVRSRLMAFIRAKDTACTQQGTAFTAQVQTIDSLRFLQWTVSNGAVGTGLQFQYSFAQPGTYAVQLIAGTVNGCYDTAYHTLRIDPSPVVQATPSLVLCRGNSAQLVAAGAATWQWQPLQGLSCYTCADPVASPTVTTPYVVEGKNGFGCSSRDTVVVTVIQPLKMQVSPDDSICIGSTARLLANGASRYSWWPATGLSAASVSNPAASPAVTTRYGVVGYDDYHCFTDTAFVTVAVGQYPAVSLGPDQTLATGTLFPLKPVVTNGPVQNWNWSPAAGLSCATCPEPVVTIKKDITYTVRVTTPYGCEASDTLGITVFCKDGQVFVPNAFTPDGDGINDLLMVRASGIVLVKYFRIFNRWGDLVFERTNFKPNEPAYAWDGKVRGIVNGPEVFVYTCEAVCENGATYTYKGNVSIIK